MLYLGEWSQAEAVDRLTELDVRRVITIHNSPGVSAPARGFGRVAHHRRRHDGMHCHLRGSK